MCTKNINNLELKEQYKKVGLLSHYMNFHNYQNKKALEEEFTVKKVMTSQKQEQIVKVAEFILAYEKIKKVKQ